MSRKRNTFSKAVKHLKSSKIEEKLQTLNEIPTMNTSGLYDVVPGALSRTEIDKDNPTVPDYSTIDWDVDGEDGRDTSGLFDAEGNSLFAAPPGDNSYILGPMAAMYYTWAYPWTMVGYIRESDRRMVNLGRIDGKLSDWDGSSGNASSGSGTFYSYGQLTLEQAQWFRDVQKNPGATNDPATYNYRAFYPGPPSNTPDAFGRYYCITTGEPLATKDNEKEVNPIELQSSDVFSALLNRLGRGAQRAGSMFKGAMDSAVNFYSGVTGSRLGQYAAMIGAKSTIGAMDNILYGRSGHLIKGLSAGRQFKSSFTGAGPSSGIAGKIFRGKKLADWGDSIINLSLIHI